MHIGARTNLGLVVALLFVAASFAPTLSHAEMPPVAGPAPGVITKPLEATWQYSSDGGKTFSPQPPSCAPANKTFPCVIRGTFDVADPAAVAGLFVRIAEQGPEPLRAAICNGDLVAASGGYWKDLGHCPTLLNAEIKLNEKPVSLTNGPMLYRWLCVESPLNKGANTIELKGDCYTYWQTGKPDTVCGRLAVAEVQPLTIYNGPILGDFGDGYFTLACRTSLPAELIVEATPTLPDGKTPAGKTIVVTDARKIWHRVKVKLPKGTLSVSYTLKAQLGAHEAKKGPYTLNFPGAQFRFAALGNVLAHSYAVDRWKGISGRVAAMKAAFVVNTGNVSEHGSWEFDWESRYCEPGAVMLASVPTLLTPCGRDFAGAVQELHYTPAADTYSHNWSKVIGPVRLIGLDGNQTWTAGSDNYKWLEKELAAAHEKFVFVLDAYPGYSSGKGSRKLHPWLLQTRNDVLPLLGKYKATAMLCGNDPDYERCEPTPDKGVTQIVTGAAGKDIYRFSPTATRLNPLSQGNGRDWVGVESVRSICVFDVKENEIEMQVLLMPDEPDAKDFKVLDRKTFAARQ
ncbi:MAG: hypothetical protein K8T25_08435 [Planctomycetia bacterium]|nr:hypothetical protein [Planctomycetia bacterium]